MRSKIYIIIFFLAAASATALSQEKSSREIKEENKLEKRNQVELMINSKDFIFEPRTAIPSGMRSVNLSGNRDYIKFQENLIVSEMPFFGRAYSGVGYGNDTGLHFRGKPEKFTVTKNKKGFEISVVVKGETDIFRIFITVASEGSASLTVSSNNRSSISYQGEIVMATVSGK